MKNKWRVALAAITAGLLLCGGAVHAATNIIQKELHYNNIKITLNGEEILPLDANGNYVEPFIIDGTTYLPVRGIANALGMQVEWDGANHTVVLTQDTTAEAQPEFHFKVNAKKKIPTATGERKLTNEELLAMNKMSIHEAAPHISTLADAYAWLSAAGYVQGGMSISPNGLINLNIDSANKNPSWIETSMILHLLLEGDYEDVGTILCVAYPREPGWAFWYISFNYVKVDGIYYVTYSPDYLSCNGLPVYRLCNIEISDLSLIKDALEIFNEGASDLITLAKIGLSTQSILTSITTDPVSITFPELKDVRYLYQANEESLRKYEEEKAALEAEEAERWSLLAPSLKISDFNLPAAIGNTTLTYEQALALVGKEPEIIAQQVKTVGDVLQYMIAARFGYNSPSAYTPWYGGWGYDAPGDDQLRQNYGCCCGGYTNTVSYLIDGDYEKAGTLRWVGNGNHTISWVYVDGKYYVFDFTQLCNGGNYNNRNADFTVLNDLRDYYDVFPENYQRNGAKEDLAIMVAFEVAFEVNGGAMYPSVWQDPPHFAGLTFPTEAQGQIIVIHQQNPEYGVLYKDVPFGVIPRYSDDQ